MARLAIDRAPAGKVLALQLVAGALGELRLAGDIRFKQLNSMAARWGFLAANPERIAKGGRAADIHGGQTVGGWRLLALAIVHAHRCGDFSAHSCFLSL